MEMNVKQTPSPQSATERPPEWVTGAPIVFVSAFDWMSKGQIRLLRFDGTELVAQEYDGTKMSVFSVSKDGVIRNANGNVLTMNGKVQPWNFSSYSARDLGPLAFTLSMDGMAISVTSTPTVQPVVASSRALQTCFFMIPIYSRVTQ